jgi:hypothetical protein
MSCRANPGPKRVLQRVVATESQEIAVRVSGTRSLHADAPGLVLLAL